MKIIGILIVSVGVSVSALAQVPQSIRQFNPPTAVQVTTNSTLVLTNNPSSATGGNRVFYRLENRGSTDFVYCECTTIVTTNLINGNNTNRVFLGHMLNAGSVTQLGADKVYDGPVTAITTGLNTFGAAVVSDALK